MVRSTDFDPPSENADGSADPVDDEPRESTDGNPEEPAGNESPERTAVDPRTVDGPILLFDGVCTLCNSLVRFVIENDPEGEFSFASLQSAVGQALLERAGRPADDLDTVVLIEDGEWYARSDAALRVARRLGFPWSPLYAGIVIPRSVRDRAYDLVASRRYDWFGRRDACAVPDEDVSDRFLE